MSIDRPAPAAPGLRIHPMSKHLQGCFLLTILFNGGCALGPDHTVPEQALPAQYRAVANWQPAAAAEAGGGWHLFGDTQLAALLQELDLSNQSLRAAAARYRQAQAAAAGARAGLWPKLGAELGETRGGTGNNSDTNSGSAGGGGLRHNLALVFEWELDLWGRLRREAEAGTADAAASRADLAAARLSAQAELALNYFQLRIADARLQLLTQTVAGYRRSLEITSNQYRVGMAGRVDVAQAKTQLKAVEAQRLEVQVQRAQLEHAIALLLGRAPSALALAAAPAPTAVPISPPGLPAALLLRRPDIAAAERRVAAANARIGVARAAWLPNLTLSARGGYRSDSFAEWIDAPHRYWSLGPTLAQTLFDGGLRRAGNAQAEAGYDATVADYRAAVLQGLREVEDNLVALQLLEQQAQVQGEAVATAREAERLLTNQYRAGTAGYLAVVVAQTTALNNEQLALQILAQRLAASVALIKALGGGWEEGAAAIVLRSGDAG